MLKSYIFKKGIRLISNIYKIILFIIIVKEIYATNLLVPQQYNSIQDAVNNATMGDTILISSGFYKENIIINKVMTIKNASTSSTVIIEDATPTPPTGYVGSYIFLVQVYGSGEISGLILQGNNNRDVYCTGMKFTQDGWLVKECTFQNLGGIYTYESSTTIKKIFLEV